MKPHQLPRELFQEKKEKSYRMLQFYPKRTTWEMKESEYWLWTKMRLDSRVL